MKNSGSTTEALSYDEQYERSYPDVEKHEKTRRASINTQFKDRYYERSPEWFRDAHE